MKALRLNLSQARLQRLHRVCTVFALLFTSLALVHAQTGPFSPTNWPATINANATVDYYIVDQNANFTTPAGWSPTVSFAGGGDQAFQSINLSGLSGDQSTSSFMNIADSNFAIWANVPQIDILMQVYGNDALY